MNAPSPDQVHPLPGHKRVAFLKPLAKGRQNVTVGDYAYCDDPDDPTVFFDRNVIHHYDFTGDHLTIGPYCAIAAGVRIVMNGATHAMGGFSTFPFNIFGEDWANGFSAATWDAANKGDTVIGADCWIGTDAMIMPGAHVGPGAIIAARAVVTGDWPAYSVIAGNPARLVRRRFDEAICNRLEALAWWDWPVDRITRNLDAIRGADLDALEAAA